VTDIQILFSHINGLPLTMDIEIRSPSADFSGDSIHASALSEKGQRQQSAQSGTFSAALKDAGQNTSMEQSPGNSKSDDPLEPIPSSDAEKQAIIALVAGVALVSTPLVAGLQTDSSPEAGRAEHAQNVQGSSSPGVESVLSLSKNMSQAEIQGTGTEGQEGAVAEAVLSTSKDELSPSAPQAPIIPGQSGEVSAVTTKQTVSRTTDESLVWNGRIAHADLSSASLNQPSSTLPEDSLISDQGATSLMEAQGTSNALVLAYMNGGRSLERPGTIIQPSMVAQEQETEETVLSQALMVPVIGDSEGRGQDPFGADAQGTEGRAFLYAMDHGVLESVTQDNQSLFFNGQLTSARQSLLSTQGESPTAATAGDSLRTTQAFLGEGHQAIMTLPSGKAHIVHMELPTHDFGPLTVRISMTDQTVHTHFTTDQNDLGALLLTRQDQLQQTLIKSGLELGQFQVHVDQQSKQEALPDRQPRRHGEGFEQPTTSQDHKHETPNRERPNHGPARTLSLFA
jgi:Flagellar hook-length control protein FliK